MSSALNVPSIDRLIHELSKLPGIGAKTAERLALSIVKKTKDDVTSFSEALLDVKALIKECPECYCYTENEGVCSFCENEERKTSPYICVVKNPTDIAKIESSGAFSGSYHVLHGCIAPLDGVGPEDVRISELLTRVRMRQESDVSVDEVIVALDADLEGDTTALYLKEILQDYNVPVSRLAHGVPMGSYIDYVDQRTLGKALENRIKL